MKLSVSFHGITRSSRQALQKTFEAHASRISRRLASFREDLVRVEGHIEKNPNHHRYRVSLRLKLPGDVLAVSEEGHDLRAILADAFDDLIRRTDKHLARLRGEHAWTRINASALRIGASARSISASAPSISPSAQSISAGAPTDRASPVRPGIANSSRSASAHQMTEMRANS